MICSSLVGVDEQKFLYSFFRFQRNALEKASVKVKIFSEARANAAELSSTALAYGDATVATAIGKILNFIVDMG